MKALGLGCMRLSTEATRNEERGAAVIVAAIDAGYTFLDTARAYGLSEGDLGHNERLVADALARRPSRRRAITVVTKVGMRRDGGAWIPDGRAKLIREQAAASAEVLGAPIDLLLNHAPDRKTAWATTVRALDALREDGTARAIGLSNPTLADLEAACDLAPISAIEIALGAYDDAAARSGIVELCARRGITVLAHTPLGSPKRAPRLRKHPMLAAIAKRRGASPAAVFLAYLASLPGRVVPLVGARRVESVLDASRALALELDAEDLEQLDTEWRGLRRAPRAVVPGRDGTDVVLLIGIQGAGKSTAVGDFLTRGYERLNRDEHGGTLRQIAERLDERLAAGATKVVLDNTYLARAQRADVVDVAKRHAARVRCVHVATPLPVAQVRLCERMLARFGRLLDPDEIARSRDPAVVAPLVQMRAHREMEHPREEEGFDAIETWDAAPTPRAERTRSGVAVHLDALRDVEPRTADAWTIFGWAPELSESMATALADALAQRVGAPVDLRLCRHGGGAPRCFCRPPLPGLLVSFVHERAVAPDRLVVVGGASARSLASALGGAHAER